MKELGLRPGAVADMAGIGHTFVYDILYGRSANPSAILLQKVADVLKTTTDQLINGTPPPAESAVLLPAGDVVPVSFVDVTASLGGGSAVDGEPANGEVWYFARDWVRGEFGAHSEALRLIHVKGDSMEPTLRSGDIIMIDSSVKSPSQGGIFVLDDGIGLVAKRLESVFGPKGPSVRVISDNPLYPSYERSMDEVRIIGKVVWLARQIH